MQSGDNLSVLRQEFLKMMRQMAKLQCGARKKNRSEKWKKKKKNYKL
jgi:hypothetical protein